MVSRQTITESVYCVEYTRPVPIPLRTKGNKTDQGEEPNAVVAQARRAQKTGCSHMTTNTESTIFRAEMSDQFFPGTEEPYDLFGVEENDINFGFLYEPTPLIIDMEQSSRSLRTYRE
jgi:hypothetical protein